MDLHARRSHLQTADNPEARLDYVVSLDGSLGDVEVRVRYVPDRRILLRRSLEDYFAAFGSGNEDRLESTATTILHDLNNELVARWVQVRISGPGHQVTAEDRQPKWDNPGLLTRLTSS